MRTVPQRWKVYRPKKWRKSYTPEEQGLSNICEVVVYLYNEVYESPSYIKDNRASKVLH